LPASRADPDRPTPALMIQGTGSDVGKSFLVAGLCRAYARRGLKVLPFKPQNMSNNAAVAADGGEIGRAQALQARAAGVEPVTDMNPVLLKPASEIGAQVIVQGRVEGSARAREYQALKPKLLPRVMESFLRLAATADLMLVEGAGSPAEVNLRAGDIANMGFAEAADLPVALAADIDRGGVIASIVGTHALLSPSERARVKGVIINRFRGDPTLFVEGVKIIEQHTGWPSFGVVPYFAEARLLPREDAMALDREEAETAKPGAIRIAVPRLPRISNLEDIDPLAAEDDVTVRMVGAGEILPADADVILLPGSKAVISDLAYLRAQGWDIDIAAHVRRGGCVVGLCGGYQMLGRRVSDPDGLEGAAGQAPGLGLLDVTTTLEREKTLRLAEGIDAVSGEAVRGYEIHLGRTAGADTARPAVTLGGGRPDGARSADGRVIGSYLHGLFAADGFRRAFLAGLRPGRNAGGAYEAGVEAALDGLAQHLETHLDLDRLLAIAQRV
jgi:adenosylcobyric acid synthase